MTDTENVFFYKSPLPLAIPRPIAHTLTQAIKLRRHTRTGVYIYIYIYIDQFDFISDGYIILVYTMDIIIIFIYVRLYVYIYSKNNLFVPSNWGQFNYRERALVLTTTAAV